VDSKRRVSEFYMYVLILLVLALFARTSAVQTYSQYVILALVVAVVIEGILIRRGLHRLIAERLPGQSTRGVTMYAIMRTLQIRKLRMPAPRVRPGDKI
jgi:fatty-acid desaturase